MKEGITAHVVELKAHADLGPKPESVQPIRGEVYRAGGQTGENPVRNHVNELQRQATLKAEETSPTTQPQRISPERIQEFLKRRPTLTEEDAKMLLALEDEIADIKRRGFRGFIFP